MLTLLGLAVALAAPATHGAPLAARERRDVSSVPLYRVISEARPQVSVWTNSTDPYQRGARARVYVSAGTDAYIMVLRIDTDGRVRVLYPVEPWQDDFVRGGRTFEVLGRDEDNAFDVDDNPGVGYIFAVASADPIKFDQFVRGDHWDYRTIANGRVVGDPYVALTDFANQLEGESDWDYDITSYDVEQHYDYPRFLCYDCHAYAAYSYWDPYAQQCPRFRIVMYNDPYYYPYYYGGRRVAVVRPIRPQARFVFKDYSGSGSYVTQLPRRPIRPTTGGSAGGSGQGYVIDRGRTGADLGGRGSIPTPEGYGRRPVRPDAGGGSAAPQGHQVQPDLGGIGPMRRPATGGAGQDNGQAPNVTPEPDANGGRRPEAGGQPQAQPRPPAGQQGQPQGEPARPERRPATPPQEPQRQPQRPPEQPRRVEPRNEAPPKMERPAPPQARPRSEPPRGGGGQPELRRRKP